jgi:hypothetical protein
LFSNSTLLKEEPTRDKKKLLGISFEKEGCIMFAIAPKCYILKSSKNENNENVKKMKGISFRLNDNIELEIYKRCFLKFSNLILGISRGFIVVESDSYYHTKHMVENEQKKKAINGIVLDKIIVHENNSYTSFLPKLTKEDYYFAK